MTTTWRLGCFIGMLIACAGCWQEVHYNPSGAKTVSSVTSDAPEESAEPRETESPVEPPAPDSQPPADEITANELFGDSEVAADPSSVADSNTPAEVKPQEPSPTDEESPIASAVPETTDDFPSSDGPESEVGQARPDDSPVPSQAEPDLRGNPDTEAPDVQVMRPSRTALAVWRMSSRWSFAAAIYAKGQPEERYRDSLEQATFAAELVGVELPAFPVSEGMSLEAAVIGYLLDAGPAAFVNKLSEDYVPEYEGLAELAIRTNALLLVYTPKSQQLDPLISSIRDSAERSGLPPELWSELVSMLERRESFDAVKQRVLSFHTEVADYLAGDE